MNPDNDNTLNLLYTVIMHLPLDMKGFSWSKVKGQTSYEFKSFSTGVCSTVEKQGRHYCVGDTGAVYPTLKEAKLEAETLLKKRAFTSVEELQSRLSSGDNTLRYSLSVASYCIISAALSSVYWGLINDMARDAGYALRSNDNRFGNAVAAFDINGDMLSFLEVAIPFRTQDNFRTIEPEKIALSVSINKNIEGELLQRDKSFGNDGFYESRISGFSTRQITEAASDAFNMAVGYALELKKAC